MSSISKISVRIRPRKPETNERLSTFVGQISQLKGSLSDVKVEMLEENKLFSDEYKITFIPVVHTPEYKDSLQPLAIEYNKGNNYLGFIPKDLKKNDGLIVMLQDAITKYASIITGARGKGENPKDFFEIVQNPWKPDPPVYRYFGQDKWILNNQSSILIKWQLPNTDPALLNFNDMTGGRSWSNEDGSEREYELGLTGSNAETSKVFKINLVKSVVIYGGEIEQVNLNGKDSTANEVQPTDLFTLTADNNFSKTEKPTSWPGSTKDIDIINQVINVWSSKIAGYGKLDLCKSAARYQGNMCDQLIYVSPLEPDVLGPGVNLDNSISGSSGPSGPSGSGLSASSSKIPLQIQLPKDVEIKVREDVPDIFVYVGEPPSDVDPFDGVEGFVFGGDDFVPLDDEYSEVAFLGDGEQINTPEEEKIDEILSQETDKKVEENIQKGTMQNVGGSLDPRLHGSTPYSTTSKIPPGFNDVPLYHQGEAARFAKILYNRVKGTAKCNQGDGSKSSIKTSGCGVCALTMAINWWALKGYIKPATVQEVADFMSDEGGRDPGCMGSNYNNIPQDKFKSRFGLVLRTNLNNKVNDEEIMKSLKAGYPCPISGKNYTGYNLNGKLLTGKNMKGHFICLTGIDSSNRIRINDSGCNPTGGSAMTAFQEGKKLSQVRTPTSSLATLYPASMSKPPWD